MRLAACVFLALLCTACAGNPAPDPPAAAQPAPVDPVGTFDFTTVAEGTSVQGTITVSRTSDGAFTGSVATNVTEPIPVTGVAVDGQTLTLTGQTPDGPITMIVEFTGNDFTGSWTLGAMSGTLSGSRRTS